MSARQTNRFILTQSFDPPAGQLVLAPQIGPPVVPGVPPNSVFWEDMQKHLHLDRLDLDNYDPTVIYVSTDILTGVGRATVAEGATGTIASPVNTLADALTLSHPSASVAYAWVLSGNFGGQPITLPPQLALRSMGGPSEKVLLGAVTLSGAAWTVPSAFFYNQCNINGMVLMGLIDYHDLPMNNPLLALSNCAVYGGIQTNGACASSLILNDCTIGTDIAIVNTNTQFIVPTFSGTNITISHNTAGVDMSIDINGPIVVHGSTNTISIAAQSLGGVLRVNLVGLYGFSVNVTAVNNIGNLELTIDDVNSINWGAGTQAKTTLLFAKQAYTVGYTPAVPGNWSVVPAIASDALDELAARPAGAGDVVGPGSSTNTAVALFDGTTGKLLKNSVWTMDSSGNISVSGSPFINVPNSSSLIMGGGAGLGAGTANSAYGNNSLGAAPSGINNTAYGANSGQSVSTGANNTLIGAGAGVNITTGGSNICIGSGSGSVTSTGSNIINIGSAGSNTSQQINIGSSQTTCNIQGIYPTAGDNTHWVTCTSAGALGVSSMTAPLVAYTPTTSADWPTVPTDVGGALDTLASIAFLPPTFYGSGTADSTIAVNTTLTGYQYLNNLTINAGIVLTTAGYYIFVRGTLTIGAGASISVDGGAAAGSTGGTNGLGANGLNSTNGAAGATLGGTTPTGSATNCMGGNGGTGGAGSSGSGGAGATGTAVGALGGGPNPLQGSLFCAQTVRDASNTGYILGGLGGGSGGGGGVGNLSGGGGGGGGRLAICARIITGSGLITSNGGAGGNAPGVNAGGGGGGGGGVISLVYGRAVGFDPATQIQVNGGGGGNGNGTGSNGNAGGTGTFNAFLTE